VESGVRSTGTIASGPHRQLKLDFFSPRL
jgi:hypothetical protein